MGPIRLSKLLSGAYIQQALAQLLLDLICGKVHVLIVLHELVEGFFLRYDGLSWLGGRA